MLIVSRAHVILSSQFFFVANAKSTYVVLYLYYTLACIIVEIAAATCARTLYYNMFSVIQRANSFTSSLFCVYSYTHFIWHS